MKAIEIQNVSKSFGRLQAVSELTLDIPEGALCGLIGPNGAGKTTLFSMLAGFLRPSSGTMLVRGEPLIYGQPPVGKIAMLPQDSTLPPRQTARKVLELLARYGGSSKGEAHQKAKRALEMVGLDQTQSEQKISELSHGQRRRVAIAQTLLGENEIICLDEPTAGVDPRAAAELREMVVNMRGKRTIIFSSHNLLEVESICTHVAILNHGKLVTSGPIDQLRREEKVISVRLRIRPEAPDTLLAEIRMLEEIASAEWIDEEPIIRFSVSEDKGSDEVVNSVVSLIIKHNGVLEGIKRGQSLEKRFLDETKSVTT